MGEKKGSPFQGGEKSGALFPPLEKGESFFLPPLEKGGQGGFQSNAEGGFQPNTKAGFPPNTKAGFPPHAEAGASPAPYGPDDFAAEFHVSRETLARLLAHDRLLLETQAHTNLIARSTIETRWARHFRDSAQLFALIPPAAQTLVDLGSGAGFPGLVLAAMGLERGLRVTLVESIAKKAAFLRAAAAAMGLANVSVIPERIESTTLSPPDVITARALASLVKLLGYAHGLAGKNTLLILPKGQDVAGELTEATKSWHMDVEQRPSLTSPGSTVLLIRHLRPNARGPAPPRRKGRTAR